MAFPKFNFEKVYHDPRQFPGHAEVQEYIEDYASDIMDKISFNEEVTSVEQQSQGKWKVQTKRGEEIEADAVAVCNGHYEVPNVP